MIYNCPDRPLEPPDCYTEPPPLRYCTRCGNAIYHGDDTICETCLDESEGRKGMLEYMESYPAILLSFLQEHQNEDFLDVFFEVFYDEHGVPFERWRRE